MNQSPLKSKILMAVAATAMLLSSCSKEVDMYNPDQKNDDQRAAYAANWTAKYGATDPEQNWNSAVSTTASIDLSNLPSNSYEVKIFTENPAQENSRLLAKLTVRGSATITFDAPKGLHSLYVTATGDEGHAINGYVEVSHNTIKIGRRSGTRATGDCPTVEDGTILLVNGDKSETLYQLKNVVIEEGNPWKVSDLKDLFQAGTGYFAEYQNNVTHYNGQFSGDVQYVMTEDSPVTMQFNYMVTSGINIFGYYYWKEGENPALAKKYVLTESGKQLKDYLKVGNWNAAQEAYEFVAHGGDTPQLGSEGMTDETMFKGSIFNLVYFDANGRASFTFPQGTHIAFFIHNGNRDANGQVVYDYRQLFNSIASYNADKNYADTGFLDHAVTFNYNGTTILGFEDWLDFDENDLVFFAIGKFEEPEEVEEFEDPEPISWMVACEDLGSTDDYDFNDIVFSVTHLAGETTATITPFAAGGIYPAHIFFGNTDLGEIHALIQSGVTTDAQGRYPMLNTTTKGTPGRSIPVTVPADFSMADGMGGFRISVETSETTNAIQIGAPQAGEAPQMFVVPAPWAWPLERHNIELAYPGFTGWNQNANQNATWYEGPINEEHICK